MAGLIAKSRQWAGCRAQMRAVARNSALPFQSRTSLRTLGTFQPTLSRHAQSGYGEPESEEESTIQPSKEHMDRSSKEGKSDSPDNIAKGDESTRTFQHGRDNSAEKKEGGSTGQPAQGGQRKSFSTSARSRSDKDGPLSAPYSHGNEKSSEDKNKASASSSDSGAKSDQKSTGGVTPKRPNESDTEHEKVDGKFWGNTNVGEDAASRTGSGN